MTNVRHKINLQNKQTKSNEEMKKLEIAANSKIPVLPNTTNVLIATRDEIMNQLFDKPSRREKLQLTDSEIIEQ